MEINHKFGKWLGLLSAAISLGIGLVFYFRQTFFDETLLTSLMLTQYFSSFVAFVFGMLSIRYWQGIITLILLVVSVYLIFSIDVGIH